MLCNASVDPVHNSVLSESIETDSPPVETVSLHEFAAADLRTKKGNGCSDSVEYSAVTIETAHRRFYISLIRLLPRRRANRDCLKLISHKRHYESCTVHQIIFEPVLARHPPAMISSLVLHRKHDFERCSFSWFGLCKLYGTAHCLNNLPRKVQAQTPSKSC